MFSLPLSRPLRRDASPFALPLLTLALFAASVHAGDEEGELIFSDNFERNESQEKQDEVGNGWGTNSKSRANGNKQVDLIDGTMHIYMHETADHAVSVVHPAEFKDGIIQLRFKLPTAKDSLGLNIADLKYKAVHAGHLCVARISTREVRLQDLKTGNMDLKIREQRQAKQVSKELQSLLDTKVQKIKHKTTPGEWHSLSLRIEGEQMTLHMDEELVGSFASEGIAHPTKRMLRLSVPKEVFVDDLSIRRLR